MLRVGGGADLERQLVHGPDGLLQEDTVWVVCGRVVKETLDQQLIARDALDGSHDQVLHGQLAATLTLALLAKQKEVLLKPSAMRMLWMDKCPTSKHHFILEFNMHHIHQQPTHFVSLY
jgi:hypothetical protein